MRTVINNKPVALVVMDAFGKYTHFADASRLRTWIETGKVMPVPAAALSYKAKPRKWRQPAPAPERKPHRTIVAAGPAGIAPPGIHGKPHGVNAFRRAYFPARISAYSFCRYRGSYCWLGHFADKNASAFPALYTDVPRCAPPGIVPRAPATAPAFALSAHGRRRLSSRYSPDEKRGT